jgi:hypothetical protein
MGCCQIEFIGRLTVDKILCHSTLAGWEWHSEAIEGCPMSQSVAELFTLKLKMLPAHSLHALQICSVFGSQIEQRIIDFIKDFDGEETVDINEGLRVAMDLGLIEMSGSTEAKVFKFPHDLISQVSALSSSVFCSTCISSQIPHIRLRLILFSIQKDQS